MNNTQTFSFAHPIARFIATLIDIVIILSISQMFFVGLLDSNIYQPVPSLIVTITIWLLKSTFEAKTGTTPGKLLTRLKVITLNDEKVAKLPLMDSLIRNSWILIEIIPIVGIFLSLFVIVILLFHLLLNNSGTAIHDRIVGSYIVKGSKNDFTSVEWLK